MDRHDLFVIVEDNDLEEPTRSIGADVAVSLTSVEYADRVSYRVFYVEVSDAVLARCRRSPRMQVTLPGRSRKPIPCDTRLVSRRPEDCDAGAP